MGFCKGLVLHTCCVFLLVLVPAITFAQQKDRLEFIQERLYALATTEAPGLNEKVAASVSGVSVVEFIRGMAVSNNLNISVDQDIKTKVSVNFNNESVQNILMFLVKQYNLDISFTGSIMYVTEYKLPVVPDKPKEPIVTYDSGTQRLSMDVRNDSLFRVVKKITEMTGINIIATPEVNNKQVTVFLKDQVIRSAIENLALANDLELIITPDSTYLLGKANAPLANKLGDKKKGGNSPTLNSDYAFTLNITQDVNGQNLITLTAIDAPIIDLIKVISQELKIDYFVFSEPQGKTTVNVREMLYEDFLAYILRGTEFAYKHEGNLYLIGNRLQEGFTTNKFIQLQYRPTDIVIENIPAELKKGVEIKAFPELNSLIVSGSSVRIHELEQFIKAIDKVVPVIMIEVIIVDVNSSRVVSTGISAGIGQEPATTGGTVFPGVDVTIGAGSINKILDLFGGGTGVLSLGKVAPNFYISLKALESQGILKVRSTPRLSTLNGHEATMSIGKTDYYVEETNNIIGSQNPQTVVTRTFKPVQADFSITINPVVSGDDHVTLNITVTQSDFTTRISNNAPPGTTNRSFQSLIRVKSDEMIVLGGLEESRMSNSGSGVPLLSRIPIIKWFFSSREKTKSSTKLNIFIKPTIIY